MSASLIDRVRERLAAESVPLRPNVVAAAIRAESGGLLGDAEVLSSLRVLQTELTGAGVLDPLLRAEGTTDVLVTAPDAVWVDDGNGLRRTSIRFADDDAVRRLAQRSGAVGRTAARRRATLGRRPADRPGHRTVHRPAACGAAADRARRHVPVAAGAPARHPGPGRADPDGHHRAGGRGAAGRHHRRAPGVPGLRRHGCGKDHLVGGRAGRGSRARTHRLRGGRRRTGARASASGEARRAVRECRGRRRGDRARPGQAGTADAAGPHRGR